MECLKTCKLNPDCNWFSFDFESQFCEALANCSSFDTTKLWIRGEATCDLVSTSTSYTDWSKI